MVVFKKRDIMAIKGVIIGDIIGSQYEFRKPMEFDNKTAILLSENCKFTDDTVLSIATKYAIQHNISFAEAYKFFGLKYRDVGYGNSFCEWLDGDTNEPYGSYGNGSAMRVSFVADYYDSMQDVVENAIKTAECTHNHPEGIKGAVVVAMCIWMAKHGISKEDILNYAICQYPKDKYAYSPEYTLDEIREIYHWNDTCQGSVPAAIRCLYEADTYTEFIRNVLSLKCDADTLCAIGGGIAEELLGNRKDEVLQSADQILEKYLDDYLMKVFSEN